MKKASLFLFLMSGISLVGLAVSVFILKAWFPFMWVLVGLVLLFLILGLWQSKDIYKEFFMTKTTKEGMSMGAMILLVVILLGIINFIGARKYKTFDFSTAQVNTLSDQSVKILQSLTEDLRVIYFYKNGEQQVEENKRAFIDLLRKYQDKSALVKLDFVEVNEKPDLAEKFGVKKGSGLVFVEYKGRKASLEKIDEQEMTGAVVKVSREKEKNIYFISGHGERDIENTKEGTGFGFLKSMLEGSRYKVTSINLNQKSSIPADADMVVIAGPEQAYLENEVKSLFQYLKSGGSLILALDPKTDHGLNSLLQNMGVEYLDKYVVQVMDTPLGKAINPSVTPVTDFSGHSITKPFGKDQFILMQLPGAFKKLSSPVNGITIEEFAKTNANSMSFSDKTFKGTADNGPFSVGVVIKGKLDNSDKEFSVVAFADSDFWGNQMLYKNLNRDLALNTAAFLAKEDNLISVTAKEVGVTKMEITPSQFLVFIFGFIVPLPILFMILGGVLWYRRRYA